MDDRSYRRDLRRLGARVAHAKAARKSTERLHAMAQDLTTAKLRAEVAAKPGAKINRGSA